MSTPLPRETQIVVIAVLGILSLILVPQFSLYGDKAMGTTAASDARTAISVCTAHNMDNIDPLSQDYVNTYMSLVPIGGTTDATGKTTGATSGKDASDSKRMVYNATNNTIDYYYRRGDAVLHGVIDLVEGRTVWNTTLAAGKRADSLAQGLKVTSGTGTSGSVGVLGVADTSLTFPT